MSPARTSGIHTFGTAAFLVSLLCISSAVTAQEALEEIIVTATKRGEVSVQDIAVGISAYSGETIEQYNAYSLDDYARLQPSLQFASAGTGDAQLIIRGIQSPGSGTVGLYFDETVMTASNFQDGGGRTPDIRLHDVRQLEVLKGPQGTLFGASSMSGTVRIISNKPDASGFDANVSAGGTTVAHGDEGYDVSGMVNVPIIKDQLAIRAVGWQETKGGFIDQFSNLNGTFEKDDVNDAEITGGRVMLKWTPTDHFAATAYAQMQNVEVDGTQVFYPEASGTLVPIPFVFAPIFFGPFGGEFGDLKVTKPSTEPWDDEIEMYGLTLELDLGKVETLATINYLDRDIFSPFDTTPTSISFGLPQVPVAGSQFQDRSILSTEIRISSKFDGPFNFVTGFFYEEDDNFNTLDVLARDPVDGGILCKSRVDCLSSPALIPNIVFARTLENDIDFNRIFAHVDYQLTDQWAVGGGVASFNGDLHNIEFTTQALPPTAFPPIIGGPPQLIPIPGINQKARSDELTYDASLSYKRSDTELYYFRAATGFRPGGINDTSLGSFFGIDVPDTFEPDSVLSVELGAKTSWFEDRLTLNAAYFHMFWDDIFVPGEEPTGAFEFIANAAEAGIDGVEVELFARPSDPWYLTLGVTWLNAELTADQTFPPGFVPAPDTPRGFDGDSIPNVPDWALTGGVQYTVPGDLLGSLQPVLRANFSYTGGSETFFNDTSRTNASIGDFFLLNLNASFYYQNWEAKLFVNNVTDELGIVDANSGSLLDGFDAFPTTPRTFGAQLNWHF